MGTQAIHGHAPILSLIEVLTGHIAQVEAAITRLDQAILDHDKVLRAMEQRIVDLHR